jgi:hypothetical protein
MWRLGEIFNHFSLWKIENKHCRNILLLLFKHNLAETLSLTSISFTLLRIDLPISSKSLRGPSFSSNQEVFIPVRPTGFEQTFSDLQKWSNPVAPCLGAWIYLDPRWLDLKRWPQEPAVKFKISREFFKSKNMHVALKKKVPAALNIIK